MGVRDYALRNPDLTPPFDRAYITQLARDARGLSSGLNRAAYLEIVCRTYGLKKTEDGEWQQFRKKHCHIDTSDIEQIDSQIPRFSSLVLPVVYAGSNSAKFGDALARSVSVLDDLVSMLEDPSLAKDDQQLIEMMVMMGQIMNAQTLIEAGHTAQVASLIERVTKMLTGHYRGHPDVATIDSLLAWIYAKLGDTDNASKHLRQSLIAIDQDKRISAVDRVTVLSTGIETLAVLGR